MQHFAAQPSRRARSVGLALASVALAICSAVQGSQSAPGATPPAKTPADAKPSGQKPSAAPPQGTAPAAPPAPEIDVPREPLVDGVKGTRPPEAKDGQVAKKPSAFQMADVIEPKALEIITRGTTVAGSLKTISLVASGEMEGGDPASVPAGYGAPHEVTLQYVHTDAYSLPRMRISPVSSGGVVVFTHNGSRGLLVDTGAKVYREARSDWPTVAPFAWSAIPAWLTNERQLVIAAGRTSTQIELRPVIVAAKVTGTETIDGVECDIVQMVKSRDVYADDAGNGIPGIIDVQRMFVEVAYARLDGFPRRVVQQVDAEGSAKVTARFAKVVVNGAVDAAMFSVTPPAGFTNAAPPPQAPKPTGT